MPPPLLLAPCGHFCFVSLVASKQAVVTAAGSVDAYAASSAALAYVLATLAWNRIPEWIKEDVAVRNLLPINSNSNNSKNPNKHNSALELSNLASVIEKLQALLVSGSTVTFTTSITASKAL